ncbi:DUF262 domain-containing protein [Nakamurella deserti]|uniref:DUF262 domain-containing protein n=1 Tax=Nakamurella deserti TaxID=2164074 RepID=UPI000DBE3120|nr:DUF262 domain-containing protein [Nakamurella deserti]
MPFESPDVPLGDLLRQVASGKIQLPDFQREWKWDSDRVASLIASVAQGHPVGVVMTLEVGGSDVHFAPKPLSGVKGSLASPEQLLLDGQQRTTSLYQALMSGEPVDTKDAREKKISRWYYIDMKVALAPDSDLQDAVVAVPADRMIRDNFGRDVIIDYSSTQLECAAEMFPAGIIFDQAALNQWMVTYLQLETNGMPERLIRWTAFQNRVLKEIADYKVPVIRLTKGTSKEAVCTVFEKVNTGGVPLNVFELLTATFASENFRLKDDWNDRRARLDTRAVLRSVENTDFLQVVSLLATRDKRERHLAAGRPPADAPGISCKRRDILRLSLTDYTKWAEPVTNAFEWCYEFLSQEHFFRADDLPYRTQLVPLAACRVILGVRAEEHGKRALIRRWFWSGVLGEMYGGSTETRFARDVEQMKPWLEGGSEPGTVSEANFRAARLLTLKTRNSAAYKGVYALLMQSDCLDWIKHQPMNMSSFFGYKIDIHHIFPKAWCAKNDIDHNRQESIVNKTAISYDTNRIIGAKDPADYVTVLEKRASVDQVVMDEVIKTHLIDPGALRAGDFNAFFSARRSALIALISDAMGKSVVEDPVNEAAEVMQYEPEADDTTDDELVQDERSPLVEIPNSQEH